MTRENVLQTSLQVIRVQVYFLPQLHALTLALHLVFIMLRAVDDVGSRATWRLGTLLTKSIGILIEPFLDEITSSD